MRTDKFVKTTTLQLLKPLASLPIAVLEKLSSITNFETEVAGATVCELGDEAPWSIYLLSGEFELTNAAGQIKSLVGGTTGAMEPVNFLKPSNYHIVAKTSVVFIRFQDAILHKAWGDQAPTGQSEPAVSVGDSDAVLKKVMGDIQRDYKANKLVIPSLPDIAIQIREAVNRPDAEAEDITRIIQLDPALAARIVQVANSPAYRGGQTITTCRMAVSRLGLKTTCDLVLSCTLQQLFESDSPVLNKLMEDVWRHSTLVGAISAVLARYLRGMDEDRALLAGLLSEIGVLPIIAYIEKYPQLCECPKELDKVIGEYKVIVGALVLQQWDFDKEMITVVKEAHNLQRESSEAMGYCDVVILANYFAAMKEKPDQERPELNEIPAFNKIAKGRLGENIGEKLLESAQSEIEEIQKMLQG